MKTSNTTFTEKLKTIPVHVPAVVDRIIVARRLLAADDGHYPQCPDGMPPDYWALLLGKERLDRLGYAEAFLAEGISRIEEMEAAK